MTKRFSKEKIKVLGWGDIGPLREAISQKQGGFCPICQRILNAPCLDHHHKKRIKGSGQIRGVLCRGCNVMLGKIENNCIRYSISQEELPEVLRRMAQYLEQEHLPYIHPSDASKPPKLMKSSYNKLKKLVDQAPGKRKCPEYPKSGKLTKPLQKLYREFCLAPEYYS